MRNTFIDINSNRAFNGDPPYVFRFDGGQSIGLNYVKKICMVSDKEHLVIKTEPGQNIFRILKMDQNVPNMESIKMNLKVYIDLDNLIAENNKWECDGFQYNTEYEEQVLDPVTHTWSPDEPQPTAWMYVYIFYILGRAEDPGEYTGDFWIDGDKYQISADFYAENEILKDNLKNFESKLPESIQKAIYDNDVHEDLVDNILINRKNKELLMNYINILGNKGSYESLLNSINWFEWGDLLRLEELWKRYVNDDLDYDYFATELNHQLTPEDTKQLANHVKSTFIGVYCALHHLRTVLGKMVYQDTFGRDYIQSPTSWQDQDASHTYVPEGFYGDSFDGNPASIIPIDNNDSSDLNDSPGQGADPAEIGTEQIMSDEDFIHYHPGTMKEINSPEAGSWARIEFNDGSVQWAEVAESDLPGGLTPPSGGSITYWHIDFNYIYNEEMPDLLGVIARWTGQDLSLKMTVLGNFFSSFFVPIHLNLIHSCIEYWAYSYALKQIYVQSVDQKAGIYLTKSMDMIWQSDLKIAPHPETMSYLDTMFRNFNTEPVFGFSTDPTKQEKMLANSDGGIRVEINKDVLRYLYKGECCPVRFIGTIYTGSPDENISIYKQRLVWFKAGEEYIQDELPLYIEGRYFINSDNKYTEIIPAMFDPESEYYINFENLGLDTYHAAKGEIESGVAVKSVQKYIRDSISQYENGHYYLKDNQYLPVNNSNAEYLKSIRSDTYSIQYVFDLDFNIGFKEEGDYVLYFEFYATNSQVYIKKFKLSIYDKMHNRMQVMKLIPAYDNKDVSWDDVNPELDLYQYADIDSLPEDFTDNDILLQSHFFTADPNGDPNKAGLNHTLIGIVEKDYDFDGDQEFDPNIDKTFWINDDEIVYGEEITGGSFEGDTIHWVDENGEDAVWKYEAWVIRGEDPDDPYWPEEWAATIGGPEEENPEDHDNINAKVKDGHLIPNTILSGKLNNLISLLEEKFPEYWWSWDRIQISKRDGTVVKIDVNPEPDMSVKGDIIDRIYPDEYPYQNE